jgi:uncharacterized protein
MLRMTLIASLALMAACGPPRLERAQPMMENPAGVNCTTRGGRLVIRQTGDGQKGYCMLPDGRSLDIWEYYRQTNP